MKVFTYLENLPDRSYSDLILLWIRSWRKHGWDPVVLFREDAEKHQGYESFLKAVKALPSKNEAGYDEACYLRWLAMVVAGGGLAVDFDVMNYGFKPKDMMESVSNHHLTFFEGKVPSVVFGSQFRFAEWTNVLATYRPARGESHVSDMTIAQKFWDSGVFHYKHVVDQFGVNLWKTQPLVHYSSRSSGREKAALIQKERPI